MRHTCGGTSGCGDPALEDRERAEQHSRGAQRGQCVYGGPAVGAGGLHGVDEGNETADQAHRSGHVQATPSTGLGLVAAGDGAQGPGAARIPMGTLTKKTARQSNRLVSDAAEEHAGGDAHAADGAPHGERGGALLAGVGGHDDGQSGGGEQGSAGALAGARRDQGCGGAGQSARQRGDGEHVGR